MIDVLISYRSKDLQYVSSQQRDETNTPILDYRKVIGWNKLKITRYFNTIGSTFSFEFYFNPDDKNHLVMADMTRNQLVKVELEDKTRFFSGFIINHTFKHVSKKTLMTISGYSIPGVLGDSNIPISTYPRQYNKMSLRQITEKLLAPFDLLLKVDPLVQKVVDKPYDTARADVSDTVEGFLQQLCMQRDVVMTHTEGGKLLYTRINTDKEPLFDNDMGIPVYESELVYDGQGIHSQITSVKEANRKSRATGRETIKNPLVPEWTWKFNPKVYKQSNDDESTMGDSVRAHRASELRGIRLTLKLDRWVVNGKLVEPNNIILFSSRELNLKKKNKWFIEQVDYESDEASGETCTVHCVLPEVYSGEEPINIFE